MINALISKIFNTGDKTRAGKLEGIRDLPAEKAQKTLGRVLFDICVENAVSFVTDEFRKEGSHFRKPDKHKLFHEILAVNFWLVDKKFCKKEKYLIDEMHNLYSLAYGGPAGLPAAADTLRNKYKIYHESWNDITGHQDGFGLKATEFIFGEGAEVPAEQTSFWIISHAYESMKTFSDIKKRCRDQGMKL
ncbi:MAG: hypothetical protein HZA16_11395 [Nitrospirae bacterium]|nr:hypothetical protein [Nitrospirota bacterium]